MALQPLGYSQNQSYFAYIEQSTWGTAMADSSNFKIFDLLDGTPPTFSPEAFLRNETKNTGRNVRDVTDVYYSEGYILQRVTLPRRWRTSTIWRLCFTEQRNRFRKMAQPRLQKRSRSTATPTRHSPPAADGSERFSRNHPGELFG